MSQYLKGKLGESDLDGKRLAKIRTAQWNEIAFSQQVNKSAKLLLLISTYSEGDYFEEH